MRNLLVLFSLVFCTYCSTAYAQKNFYDFTVTAIDGSSFPLSSLKGKKVMVNVASKCGLTPQYEQLQELYDTYKDNNFLSLVFLQTTSWSRSQAQTMKSCSSAN